VMLSSETEVRSRGRLALNRDGASHDGDVQPSSEAVSHSRGRPTLERDGTSLLTVYIRIKVHMDLQADKSPVVVKGPFFSRVVKPRYQIRRTMCIARIQSSKEK
jgi:hypothetical protein